MLYDAAKQRFPIDNYLLSALPAEEFNLLRAHMEPVSLPAGEVYAEFGSRLTHCYFPNNGMVSLLSVVEAGDTCEVGYVGFEGIVGLPAVFGKNEMPYQALVQVKSEGFRVPVGVVGDVFHRSRDFHDQSLQFMYLLLRQFAQTSACNRFHSIEERMCRWFSVMCERSGDKHLALTQEFLAYMLGVQRTSIGATAKSLQEQGIIRYARGKVQIADFHRLKAHACECFSAINQELREFSGKKKSPSMSTTRQTRALSK